MFWSWQCHKRVLRARHGTMATTTLRRTVVSAPGKIILHGEHSVVHGKTALAASLALRTTLELEPLEEGQGVRLELPDLGIDATWTCDELAPLQLSSIASRTPSAEELEQLAALAARVTPEGPSNKTTAATTFLFLYCSIAADQHVVPSARVSVSSKLPIGAGLGSSGAFSVCLAAGLLYASSRIEAGDHHTWASEACLDAINKWSFEAEKLHHGKPSGIDNDVSTYGGARRFIAGVSSAVKKMPKLRILLVNTRQDRSTRTLVASVSQHLELVPEVVNPILHAMDQLALQCEATYARLYDLQESDSPSSDEAFASVYKKLEYLVDVNHHLLNSLTVGHRTLERVRCVSSTWPSLVYSLLSCQVLHAAQDLGFHAKLTGAGGGGCAWVLVRPGMLPELCEGVARVGNSRVCSRQKQPRRSCRSSRMPLHP
eukprot:m.219622 g.219622  ORF g.219622 m.219622 type:complete len:430 (+) comp10795_c0_seq6:253-1542(+)